MEWITRTNSYRKGILNMNDDGIVLQQCHVSYNYMQNILVISKILCFIKLTYMHVKGVCYMKAETIYLCCHQKCQLTAEIENGKISRIEDSSLIIRTPPCVETCPVGMDIPGYVIAVSQGTVLQD